ncbi:hypothetical protein F3Y22_tig00111098pilonHSYRG00011 [Hibiscus syriacus]|uniref:PQ-loop repeat family protein / transmembrane family protein n=1 Tax=Hibiscus syriacus TaxID=106335 RepID=A0A6A2Z0J0_HIBSY|nr:hypothetical protein F3Y22_tig00111098pilonHSYRG00011 [Hibiscus syriacus]
MKSLRMKQLSIFDAHLVKVTWVASSPLCGKFHRFLELEIGGLTAEVTGEEIRAVVVFDVQHLKAYGSGFKVRDMSTDRGLNNGLGSRMGQYLRRRKKEIELGYVSVGSLLCQGKQALQCLEIPQIIANFQTKSSHGVSLLFLLTWVAGDVFNLVGRLLEPATLPTQFYTALLYTGSTVVLVLQTVYYDYVYKWWKCGRIESDNMVNTFLPFKVLAQDEKTPLKPAWKLRSGIPILNASPKSSPCREYYFMSARSLAASGTPPFRTYLREHGVEHSALGQWLGWLMAAVYMGGRIPRIWLNIKRGSVEGLNPHVHLCTDSQFCLCGKVGSVSDLSIYFTHRSKNQNVEPVVSRFRHQV